MLADRSLTGKSGADDARIAPPDPRIVAFIELCKAVDRLDYLASKRAISRLRPLGFSIVPIKPAGQGDVR